MKVFCQKHENGIANSEDPDQTAPLGTCTICPDLSAQKLRVITVTVVHKFCIMFYNDARCATLLLLRHMHFAIPPVYEVYRGYIVFAFSVRMFVCLSVSLSVCNLFFRQRFLRNYLT